MNIGGFSFEVISEKPSKDNAKREENKIKGRFFDYYAQLRLKGVYKTNLSLSLRERLGEGFSQIVVPPSPILSLKGEGQFPF